MWKHRVNGFLLLGLAMAGLVALGASSAYAASTTATADIENFGAASGNPAIFGGTVQNASVVLALPAIDSLDTIDLELAHAYLSDLEFKVTDPNGVETVIIVYEDEIIASGVHDDRTPLGDSSVANSQNSGDVAILLSQTALYTLDPNATESLNDHYGPPNFSDPNGALAPGSYRPGEPTPGDFDQDLDADGADFLVWQRDKQPFQQPGRDLGNWQGNFGGPPSEATWPTGGFPAGNWTLTLTDGYTFNDPGSLGDVTFNYTEVPGSVSAGSSIPEPGSACLVLVGCSLLGFTRRKRR